MRAEPKPTPKQNRVVDVLRREILDGTFQPQSRLPTQSEIAQRFQVSSVTAHLAMTRLAREGFVYARKHHGTFVAERPPHLNDFALVFSNDPAARVAHAWSRYYRALTDEALRIQREDGRRILLFHGVDQHTDTEDRQRLLAYMQAKRLGGMIFANFPHELMGTPIFDEPGIPRVTLLGGSATAPHVPAVILDGDMWHAKAFAALAAQGRRRIAMVLLGTGTSSGNLEDAMAHARRQGLTIPPYWQQMVPSAEPAAARNLVHLLLRGDPASRPDGLIICDDNIVEHSLAGLIAANVRVPEDVAVVAHCNFPYPPPSVLPVTRLGHHIGQALQVSLDLLIRQRRGESVPRETTIPALYEDEAARVDVRAPVA